MKTSRKLLQRPTALPPSFESFFSFPIHKTGYSGVATYTRKSNPCCVPLKAEEGLTGYLQPKPPLSLLERVSSSSEAYPPPPLPSSYDEDEGGAGEEEIDVDYKLLDTEGRSLTLDFGLFVLINTYCPNSDSSDARASFKRQYHALLSARIHTLIHQDKREVVLVGDLNACAGVIDHVEGELIVAKGLLQEGVDGEEGGGAEEEDIFFAGESREGRRWLRDLLIPTDAEKAKKGRKKGEAEMIDTTRKFWPGWNTKLSARSTNYGTRIDYILTTPGLLPWLKHGDTQPHIKGSDHCPVYLDFHDEIVDEGGRTVRLEDVFGARAKGKGSENSGKEREEKEREKGKEMREEEILPPRIAARFWEEFSGRQTSLQQFFGAGAKKQKKEENNTSSVGGSSSTSTSSRATPTPTPGIEPSATPTPSTVPSSLATPAPLPTIEQESSSAGPSKATKRKLVAPEPVVVSSSKKAKTGPKKSGQQSIASFFGKPAQAPSSSSKSSLKSKSPSLKANAGSELNVDMTNLEVDLDEDYKLALQLSQQDTDPSSSQQTKGRGTKGTKGTSKAWTTLLAPTQAPKCRVHNEPAKEFTVNKPGVNKGKRPIGPGYDMGKSERPREQVDPQYRCDFFKWSSDVRKEMMGGKKGGL
ncbi:hypothetical protein MD484_g4348, partial [Candolleomyces efflorescens]